MGTGAVAQGQAQYSLDGMMGMGGAPSANNFLDSMGGMNMGGAVGQASSASIVLADVSDLDSERF